MLADIIIGLMIIGIIILMSMLAVEIITEPIEHSADLEPPDSRELEPVDPEFERRAERIFRAACRNHPMLRDENITFQVVEHLHHPVGTLYGVHKPGQVHQIAISYNAHVNHGNHQLYDTVCHELAHVIDHNRRGNSQHDGYFELCQQEIEELTPEVPA